MVPTSPLGTSRTPQGHPPVRAVLGDAGSAIRAVPFGLLRHSTYATLCCAMASRSAAPETDDRGNQKRLLAQSVSAIVYTHRLHSLISRTSTAMSMARSTNSATLTKSASTSPRVVSAGVPIRTPPGYGLQSYGPVCPSGLHLVMAYIVLARCAHPDSTWLWPI